jgi:hypothetical protein
VPQIAGNFLLRPTADERNFVNRVCSSWFGSGNFTEASLECPSRRPLNCQHVIAAKELLNGLIGHRLTEKVALCFIASEQA